MASVKRPEGRLIGVVFGGSSGASRDRHMKKLLDKGFAVLAKQKAKAREAVAPQPRLAAHKSDKPDEDDSQWAIQVGAFSSHDPAFQTARKAIELAPSILEGRHRARHAS